MSTGKIIYTIGHSTRSFEEFVAMLTSYHVKALVDIRSYPGSKRYPQFNKENLQKELPDNHINYYHLLTLGGRRKALKNSQNIVWKNEAFRGYADYMDSSEFKNGIKELESIASNQTTAYMCSEAVWWRCHRSLVSDYLKWKGWEVLHIMALDKTQEHPYTAAAKIVNGQLDYTGKENLLF